MIDSITHELVLQQYPVLRETSSDMLDVLMASATRMSVPAGAMMFDENQPCMGFALLLSGSARVVKAAPNGRELHLYDVTPGEACILTSSCLLGRSAYRARCTVLQPAELVVLPPATFKLLFSASEAFREYVFSRYSERISDLLQLVSAVAFQKLDQRLAAWLAARPSPIHITHQALADDLGSLREIVSRVLKNFAEQGWVELGRQQIDVLDTNALRQLSTS
ncbi:MAG TPA: Crp/Fnr family transcriptional regulator [Ideonella sp.]|uniref:Crp/Fnr family transcriptional regulator n=1 Tax=Ideonella sp. TaxID=1929293 RepID=UPI002CC8D2C6|nr:Crp/Fnr family transcriptional regulator [Ideonella sp.]HSI50272.1 Crp/Fnr family transcriptional regulator [Ideonella sp.]